MTNRSLPLSKIPLGSRFRVAFCSASGKLVGRTPGAAVVEFDRDDSRDFVTSEGVEVHISGGRKRLTISTGTEVEVMA